MKKNLKIVAVGALAAIGLASGAVAQQNSTKAPAMSAEQNRQVMSGGMQNGPMMGMMADPQMRKQMTEMMASCNAMMQKMGNMPAMDMKPRA